MVRDLLLDIVNKWRISDLILIVWVYDIKVGIKCC
jgi:hypothetical protein